MIVKKIPRNKSKNKAATIRDLIDYIRDPKNQNKEEKILYSNARGFLCDSHLAQREEMVALATDAVRSKSPVNHYVLSWREGEIPTPEQVEEAVSLFTKELGLSDHQCIYALHSDTDNIHLHIAINRVHPQTQKAVEINKGFDLEAAHRAVAMIEHTQGWQREENGRYQVENGQCVRVQQATDTQRQPDQKKRDMEHRTGEKSAERIAIEEASPIIKQAKSWAQLHEELAAKGMRYEKTGSGAVVFVGDVAVKASSVDRNASLAKLQKRLGDYQAPSVSVLAARRQPEPIKNMPGWDAYIAARHAHYAAKASVKEALYKRQEQERKALYERQKTRRSEILGGNWKGKGQALNAMRSLLAAEQAAEKAALKALHQHQRKQLREQFRPYPDFETWQRLQNRPDQAEQWRYRTSQPPPHIEGDTYESPRPRDIRAYRGSAVGRYVYYKSDSGKTAFVDKGKKVDIYDHQNLDAIRAALQLSAQKWGQVHVNGSAEFKELCVKLAAREGFRIKNPELQTLIAQEREWIQQERNKQGRKLDKPGRLEIAQGPTTQPPHSTGASRTEGQPIVTARDDGRVRKPNPLGAGRKVAPAAPNRLRTLSELPVLQFSDRGQVLLPDDGHRNLEQPGTKPDHALRWDHDRKGLGEGGKSILLEILEAKEKADKEKAEKVKGKNFLLERLEAEEAAKKAEREKTLEPAEQYIAEREEKRQRGINVPKHEKYRDEEGTFEFAGIRNVSGQALALLKSDDTVFVRPVDQDTAESLKWIGIGDKVNVTQDGVQTSRGMKR